MRYWHYYIVLESDLLACRRYVEFSPQNLGTFSLEFMHLLFATCSEAEIVLKTLCARLGKKNVGNIVQYKATVEPNLKISTFTVQNLVTSNTVSPFSEWRTVDSLLWWDAYNNVKHNRSGKFEQATLQNCMNALAGLFVLNLYQEHVALEDADLAPESRFFKPMFSCHKRKMAGIAGYKLPDAHKLAPN